MKRPGVEDKVPDGNQATDGSQTDGGKIDPTCDIRVTPGNINTRMPRLVE